VLNIKADKRLVGKFELDALLEKGLADMRAGRVSPAHEVLEEIRAELQPCFVAAPLGNS